MNIENQLSNQLKDREQIVQRLQVMLTLCKYSCVVVQLQRGMRKVFGLIENKVILLKFKSFVRIKKQAQAKSTKIIKQLIHKKIEKFVHLFAIKETNVKMYSFLYIQQSSNRNKKLKKYQQFERQIEGQTPGYQQKVKQFQRLSRKYNRLISQLSLLNQKSFAKLKTTNN